MNKLESTQNDEALGVDFSVLRQHKFDHIERVETVLLFHKHQI